MADRPHPTLALDISEQDHVQGSPSAAVTLIEYGDFECPYSRDAVRTVKALQREFGDQLRFVFRHFPLTAKHPHALQAAEAAEAAAAQGKFWDMYERLFANQRQLDERHLITYAKQLGLDQTVFRLALVEHHDIKRVRADVASGKGSGVKGTPTFFINGRRYEGEEDVPGLRAAIRQVLTDG